MGERTRAASSRSGDDKCTARGGGEGIRDHRAAEVDAFTDRRDARDEDVLTGFCGCVTDNASVDFRLRRGGLVEVDVIAPDGTLVRRLAR
jgi:hypothetical protein